MIEEGEQAPTFELPGVRDGEIEQIGLSEYVGDDIVILAFYPGDFNPACSDGRTDLDELDLLTMQKDVSILGLSADSVYSHRAFADEYDLHFPLLSDAHGDVATEYGVAVESEAAGHLTRRAVVVLGPRSDVEYTWVAEDIEELPDVDEIRDAIQDVGGQDTALARYRVGHAHYIEGRRAFTSAMNAFEEKEWMVAKGDFDRAYEAFDEAEDEFNTAARFAENERSSTYFEHAERKAESLWRAAKWLSDSANAYASGEGGTAQTMRRDAETPLKTARDIHEPPDPDEFPPEEDPADFEATDIGLEDDGEASLDLDIEEQSEDAPADGEESMEESIPGPDEGATATSGRAAGPELAGATGSAADSRTDDGDAAAGGMGSPTEPDSQAGVQDGENADATAEPGDGAEPDGSEGEGEEIDEAELEEIAAELEEQTEAAQEQAESGDDDVVPNSIDVDATGEPTPDRAPGDEAAAPDKAGPGSDGEDDEEIELDLADPMEGEDDEENSDDEDTEGTDIDSGGLGDHGVPDSL